ncbi:MAG: hypothetical protein KY410_04885 [Proteobacteria bacterium]|nr:hypothetical protein [Pseudomonadota bacterium]
MSEKHFKLVDPATGQSSELPLLEGSLGASTLDIAGLYKQHGVFTYDPGFGATASCKSAITFIDGEKGVLLYRGYPVEQLAKQSNFLEVSYLLLHGDLPTKSEQHDFSNEIVYHTMINESLLRFFHGFHYDAHPMAMLSAVVSSLSAFYHGSTNIHEADDRDLFATAYEHLVQIRVTGVVHATSVFLR